MISSPSIRNSSGGSEEPETTPPKGDKTSMTSAMTTLLMTEVESTEHLAVRLSR